MRIFRALALTTVLICEAPPPAAAQQINAACENKLVQLSPQLNSVCCKNGNNCHNGLPTTCTPACALIWNPFAKTPGCAAFIQSKWPNLVAFSAQCARLQHGPVTPPPPPKGPLGH